MGKWKVQWGSVTRAGLPGGEQWSWDSNPGRQTPDAKPLLSTCAAAHGSTALPLCHDARVTCVHISLK